MILTNWETSTRQIFSDKYRTYSISIVFLHCKWRAGENQVHIYVFPEMKLLFLKQKNNALSLSSYTHISMRFIYFQDRSAYSAAGIYVDRSWEYINHSLTNKYGNWDWGRTIPRKGKHKLDFPSSVNCLFCRSKRHISDIFLSYILKIKDKSARRISNCYSANIRYIFRTYF